MERAANPSWTSQRGLTEATGRPLLCDADAETQGPFMVPAVCSALVCRPPALVTGRGEVGGNGCPLSGVVAPRLLSFSLWLAAPRPRMDVPIRWRVLPVPEMSLFSGWRLEANLGVLFS